MKRLSKCGCNQLVPYQFFFPESGMTILNKRKLTDQKFSFACQGGTPRGEGDTWVNFCWVCAAGLTEPLTHYSLFCGQF